MEKAQIKFLPVRYFPSFNLQEDHYRLQAELRNFYHNIEKHSKNGCEAALRKQNIHNKLRESIKICN